MNNVHDDRPTTPSEDPLAIILAEIRKLSTRLEHFEHRLEVLSTPDIVPPLSLRSDGKVLLAVSHVEGANIAGRERWEGIVLSVTETADVFRAMSDAADDAAGHTAGHIRWHDKKRDSDPDEGGDGGQG
jgi:hypothetical protein